MPKVKAIEHLSITAKIATSVFLLVALGVAVSLVGLYGLKSMQKAVDTACQASEVLVAVNTVTERVEHFIASYDKDSLLKAKAIMADTLDRLTVLALTRPNEAISLTTGLKRFAEAIEYPGHGNGYHEYRNVLHDHQPWPAAKSGDGDRAGYWGEEKSAQQTGSHR